ncbi:hypothetical protein RRG08_003492 [Elysia crispata]|uniref:Uncharacterized protein n=1 Tax=Elysia crispata TaxID=231223 RepID=A0AAE0Y7H0_9GAST|nr:hypothetical protein RRG08_003492 [Elysia crispata]
MTHVDLNKRSRILEVKNTFTTLYLTNPKRAATLELSRGLIHVLRFQLNQAPKLYTFVPVTDRKQILSSRRQRSGARNSRREGCVDEWKRMEPIGTDWNRLSCRKDNSSSFRPMAKSLNLNIDNVLSLYEAPRNLLVDLFLNVGLPGSTSHEFP